MAYRERTPLDTSTSPLEPPLAILRAVIEASPDAILVTNLHREVIFANAQVAAIWNHATPSGGVPTRVLLHHLATHVRETDWFARRIDELFAQPGEDGYDQIELRDGRVFVQITRPYRDAAFQGRIWIYHEITAQVWAETEARILKRLAEILNQAFEPTGALQDGLELLARQLRVQSGWLWVQDTSGTMRLAANYHAPISVQPELARSHQCECILRLMSGQLSDAGSLILCSRHGTETPAEHLHHLSIPVRAGGLPVGIINLMISPEHSFTAGDIQLITTVSNQFGVAIERARLFDIERAQRESAEALNAVSRAISSTLDLDRMLQTVARLAAEITEADASLITLLNADGRQLETLYRHNIPAVDLLPSGQALAWRVITGRQPVVLPATDEPAPGAPRDDHSAQTGVPMMAGSHILGALVVFKLGPRTAFSPRVVALLEAIGRQAGLAVQNARSYAAARERAEQLEALRVTMAEISAELELPELLAAICQRAIALLHGSSGEVALYDDQAGELTVVVSQGLNQSYAGQKLQRGEGVMGMIAASQTALIVPHYATWPQRSPHYATDSDYTILGVPMIVASRLVGVITVGDHVTQRQFSTVHVRLLELFAQQAAIAIQNARLFEEVQQLATVDPLTGIANRRHFITLARHEIDRARRYHNALSMIILDIDYFKQINDTYGHLTGDRVLAEVAATCRAQLRITDTIARYGGEEFVILLPETDIAAALRVAERLRQACVQLKVAAFEHRLAVTISLGVAEMGNEHSTLEELIVAADQALYRAKQAGRNLVCS